MSYFATPNIVSQLLALYHRTGAEIFLCLLQGDTLHWSKLHLWSTSEVFDDYFQMCFDMELGDWVQKLECYKLGKVPGMSSTPRICSTANAWK